MFGAEETACEKDSREGKEHDAYKEMRYRSVAGSDRTGGPVQSVDGETGECKHYRTLQHYCLTEERQPGVETISVKV